MSNDIVTLVSSQRDSFLPVISDSKIQWEKESKFAIQLFQKNDYLAKAALSNPESARNAIINVAAIGISLNPAQKHAYLVPRSRKVGNKYITDVCLDISYMGLIHLATDSGSIEWAQSILVYSNDHFKMKPVGQIPEHEYNPFCTNRGEIVGVYSVAKTAHGDFLCGAMSIEKVHDIRARSESFKKGYGPWLSDYEEMVKKTVIKREQKYWPKTQRLANAIEYLNTVNGEGFEQEPVMPYVDESEIKANEQAAIKKLQEEAQVLIDQMELSESEQQLKDAFAKAFKMTRQHAGMNQNVQQIYAKNKNRLNIK